MSELALLDPSQLFFLVFFGFMAAFIDSIVGGGGLISVPALMWTGLPPVSVLATNKGAAIFSSLTSFVTFLRSGKMDTWLIKRLFPLALIGSGAGVFTVRLIPPEILRPLVTVMLVLVLIYTLFKKDWGKESHYEGMSTRMLMLAGLASFSLGFYDGFFGPGAGSFMLFSFLMIGFDFIGAAAGARALNFASNLSAFALFAWLGLIEYSYALPMGLSMIVGAYTGSRLALTRGTGFVRPLFIVMTTLLIGKQLLELLK